MVNARIVNYAQTITGANADPGVVLGDADCSSNNSLMILAKGSIGAQLRLSHINEDGVEFAPNLFTVAIAGSQIHFAPGSHKVRVRVITTGDTDIIVSIYPRSI